MPLEMHEFKLTLNKRNPWNFFLLDGTDFPAHNRCLLVVCRSDDPTVVWHSKVTQRSTDRRLVCGVQVPHRIADDKRPYESETLDITVTNADDPADEDTLEDVPVEIVDEP